MQGVRSLELLHKHGSTSRVLNLLRVYENNSALSSYNENPIFLSPKLNRALLVKHSLRRDETYLFPSHKSVATKIIFPLVNNSLAFGGQFVFVGQNNFRKILYDALGGETEETRQDAIILEQIDKIPSLDPFLLREHLRRHGNYADDCYFDIAPIDLAEIRAFAAIEVKRLVQMAFNSDDGKNNNETDLVNRMVGFILSNEADDHLMPMRIALGLQGSEFKEGVFAWRGFLYFKWQLQQALGQANKIVSQIDNVQIVNCTNFETKRNIKKLSDNLKVDIVKIIKICLKTVDLYDKAFTDLVDKAKAGAFREFLLSGPKLFLELGTMMGGINHILSFWKYRFGRMSMLQIEANDYEALLIDFKNCLTINQERI
jgi:hypothetical protein